MLFKIIAKQNIKKFANEQKQLKPGFPLVFRVKATK